MVRARASAGFLVGNAIEGKVFEEAVVFGHSVEELST
jgi:hypothetical protein